MTSRKKKCLYSLVILCSIVICFVGIQTNMRQKQQRKVAYAKTTIKQEAEKIKNYSASVDSFYKEGQSEFLIDTLNLASVLDIEKQVMALRVTTSDYNLNQEDFSEDQELVRAKEQLLKKIEEVKMKQVTLQAVTGLVVHLPANWSSSSEEIVSKEETTLENIRTLQQTVEVQKGAWHQSIAAVLESIEVQVIQYENIKQSIDEMMVEGELTDKATSEAVAANYSQLVFIKNEQLNAQLAKKLATIEEQLLGYQFVPEETVDSTASVEDYGE